MSDLHLEFEDALQRKRSPRAFSVPATESDVIVLAGDIGNRRRGLRFAYRTSTELKKPVIFVAGNHEYWGSVFQYYIESLEKYALVLQTRWPNAVVHLLDNSSVTIRGVRFLGTTLWDSQGAPNDFAKIRFVVTRSEHAHYTKLQPGALALRHRRDKEWLLAALIERGPEEKVVVVSHHPPHPKCLASGQAAPFADMREVWESERVPDLWISGHTHHACDFVHGSTRIVSNPRGYPDESTSHFDPRRTVVINA
jgi:3',5'-cyclic AMP phosphodiesterase CpdA